VGGGLRYVVCVVTWVFCFCGLSWGGFSSGFVRGAAGRVLFSFGFCLFVCIPVCVVFGSPLYGAGGTRQVVAGWSGRFTPPLHGAAKPPQSLLVNELRFRVASSTTKAHEIQVRCTRPGRKPRRTEWRASGRMYLRLLLCFCCRFLFWFWFVCFFLFFWFCWLVWCCSGVCSFSGLVWVSVVFFVLGVCVFGVGWCLGGGSFFFVWCWGRGRAGRNRCRRQWVGVWLVVVLCFGSLFGCRCFSLCCFFAAGTDVRPVPGWEVFFLLLFGSSLKSLCLTMRGFISPKHWSLGLLNPLSNTNLPSAQAQYFGSSEPS